MLSTKIAKSDEKITDMFKSIADAAKDLTETLKKVENSTQPTKGTAPATAAAPKPAVPTATTPIQSLASRSNSNFEVPKEKVQSLAISKKLVEVKKADPE